jgi:hypothetical protein
LADKTKKINAQESAQWHVRDENDAVFGPVDFDTLKSWVEDGRVSPLSRVSCDNRASWTAAVEIPALEMDCIAEIEPGSFYGPIHRRAMEDLIRAGSIPAAAQIFMKRGGDAEQTGGVAVMRDALRLAEERAAEAAAECAALRAADAQRRAERQALQAERDTLRAERDALRVQSAQMAAECDALRVQSGR